MFSLSVCAVCISDMMQLLGLSFILNALKLSAGSGFKLEMTVPNQKPCSGVNSAASSTVILCSEVPL